MGLHALNAGKLGLAEENFHRAVSEGDVLAINNLGVVAIRRGDREGAIRYYTLAARYGVVTAQSNLVQLGASVPPADLALGRAADSPGLIELLAIGAGAYAQGAKSAADQPPAPRPPALFPVAGETKCVSKVNTMTRALETTCK